MVVIGDLNKLSKEEIDKLNKEIKTELTRDIEQFEAKKADEELERRKRLEELISSFRARDTITLEIEGVKIPIRRVLTSAQRKELFKLSRTYKENAEDVGEDVYRFMASICKTAPWNDPATWRLLDEETGETPGIFVRMMELFAKEYEAMQSFRSGKGSNPVGDVQSSGRPK